MGDVSRSSNKGRKAKREKVMINTKNEKNLIINLATYVRKKDSRIGITILMNAGTTQ